MQTSLIALLINTICILGGSGVGLLLRKGIRKEITDMILIGMGLYVVYLGITSLSKDTNAVVLVLSICFGIGLVMGAPVFFLTRNSLGTSGAIFAMGAAAAPAVLLIAFTMP